MSRTIQPRLLDRLAARIEALPESIRPAAYGALFIILIMLMRGAWFILPAAVIYTFVARPHPWADLALGASVGGLAMLGGALSGLAYGFLGRHIQRFPGGRYLAGILTVAPYMLLLMYIIGLLEAQPLWRRPSIEDLVISGSLTLLFGLVMGHTWFGPEPDAAGKRRKGARR